MVDSTRNRLRVAQVFEPGVDGVFRVVELLVRNLIEEGHEVSIAYSDRRASSALFELVEWVESHGGSTLNLGVRNSPELRDISAWRNLRRWLLKVRPQAVHAHSSKAGALVRSMGFAKKEEPRIFYTPHAYYGLSGRRGIKASIFDQVERRLGKSGMSCMTSEEEERFAHTRLAIPAHKTRLVRNCVDTERFRAGPCAEARRDLGIPQDATVLGAVGRLSFQKDPQTMYRAFAQSLAKNPSLYLLHIGEGELQQELSQLATDLGIGERVVRKNYFDDTAPVYRAMDGLIMTSRYEGLSMVSLEALSSNLPLILSEVPGIVDLEPQDLSHCWIVPVGDVGAFSRAIDAWGTSRGARVCNHRARAQERFGIQPWLEVHRRLYAGA